MEINILQAHCNVFNSTIDPSCSHCQLVAKDQHLVGHCPVFHDYTVSSVELLKQIILQENNLRIWNSRFSDWEMILRVLVCQDLIAMLPQSCVQLSQN